MKAPKWPDVIGEIHWLLYTYSCVSLIVYSEVAEFFLGVTQFTPILCEQNQKNRKRNGQRGLSCLEKWKTCCEIGRPWLMKRGYRLSFSSESALKVTCDNVGGKKNFLPDTVYRPCVCKLQKALKGGEEGCGSPQDRFLATPLLTGQF